MRGRENFLRGSREKRVKENPRECENRAGSDVRLLTISVRAATRKPYYCLLLAAVSQLGCRAGWRSLPTIASAKEPSLWGFLTDDLATHRSAAGFCSASSSLAFWFSHLAVRRLHESI